jgi:anti-anti-sigma regulatory factor
LCHLSKKLKHIFAITRLNNVFEIFETEVDAIASVKSP